MLTLTVQLALSLLQDLKYESGTLSTQSNYPNGLVSGNPVFHIVDDLWILKLPVLDIANGRANRKRSLLPAERYRYIRC
jgi:hypothetical protein